MEPKTVSKQNGVKSDSFKAKPVKRRPIYPTYRCDICGVHPIKEKRWECDVCDDFDVCDKCYNTNILGGMTDHEKSHTFSMFVVKKKVPLGVATSSLIGSNWNACPLTKKRREQNDKVPAIDVLKSYLMDCGVDCPNATRWQSTTVIKTIIGYEEGIYEYHQVSSVPIADIPHPLKRTILLTSIAFTGTSFLPSFNVCFENIKYLEATKFTMTAILAAVTKIFMWYESLPVPYSSGTTVYSAWSEEKKLDNLLKELRNDTFWNKAITKAVRDNANEKSRKLFVLYFEEIANIWNEMSILSPKSTLVSRIAKNHLSASIKTSCYVGFLFKTIIFRIRNYGMSYMWDIDFLKRKGVAPTMFTEVFTDFEGPFQKEIEDTKLSAQRQKLKTKDKAINRPKSSLKKRKASDLIPGNEIVDKLKVKKFKKRALDDVELAEKDRAKYKTLEAKVGIISHALTIALEKLEKLTAFVETIANRVTS